MGFLDSLSKTLSNVGDRAKFEADKFQRTSRISGEISNVKSQIDTNVRQLGERALELYQQGAIGAPEIASLAQIIAQLREQQSQKEAELATANGETFEAWQATQPQGTSGAASQNVPISSESSAPTMTSAAEHTKASGSSYGATPDSLPSASYGDSTSTAAPSFSGRSYEVSESTDISGSGLPNTSSVGGQPEADSPAKACPNCGYSVPGNAAFCPNCGARTASA